MFTELRAPPLPSFWLHHFTALSNSAQLVTRQLLRSTAQTTPRTPGICPGLPTALASEFSVEWLPEISHSLRKLPRPECTAANTPSEPAVTEQAGRQVPPFSAAPHHHDERTRARPAGSWSWKAQLRPVISLQVPGSSTTHSAQSYDLPPPCVTPSHFSQDDRLKTNLSPFPNWTWDKSWLQTFICPMRLFVYHNFSLTCTLKE